MTDAQIQIISQPKAKGDAEDNEIDLTQAKLIIDDT